MDQAIGSRQLDLPAQLKNRNVLVEVTARGISRSTVITANSLALTVVEPFGRLQVLSAKGRSPVEGHTSRFTPRTAMETSPSLRTVTPICGANSTMRRLARQPWIRLNGLRFLSCIPSMVPSYVNPLHQPASAGMAPSAMPDGFCIGHCQLHPIHRLDQGAFKKKRGRCGQPLDPR